MRRSVIATVIGLGALVASAIPATAGLKEDLAAVGERIDDLRSAAGETREGRTAIANAVLDAAEELEIWAEDLAVAEGQLQQTEERLADTRVEMVGLIATIDDRTTTVEQLRGEMALLKDAARARAVVLYMQGNPSDTFDLFDIGNVGRVSVGLVYAERIQEVVDRDIARFALLSASEQRHLDRLAVEQSTLEARAADLDVLRLEYSRVADTVGAATAEVESRLADQQAVLDEIDHEISHIEGEIASLEREQRRIEQQIAFEQSLAGRQPGQLVRPVAGGVSSGFGYRIHPILGDRRMHTGWDMNAACGEPIRAAEAGRVFVNGTQGGYGITVMLDHGGGMATLYAHQTRTAVAYGQRVSAGDVIGYIGSTGLSTACHLHFEVRIAGVPVDPADFL